MQYRQKTSLYRSPYTIHKLSNFCIYCYRMRQKRRKIAPKIAKNTGFQISPFALPPIGHCGEKFNIGAQPHLFRYKMSSKVCAKVQVIVVVLVRTNIPLSVRFLNHSRKFDTLWCSQLKNYPEYFI